MASFTDKKGLFATVLFHGVILFLLLFFSFTTPKPEEGEEGILVNFGSDETGSGNEDPEYNIEENLEEASQTANQPEVLTEELLTQEEESPVTEYVAEKPEIEKPVETNSNTQTENNTEPIKPIVKRTADPKYSFTGRNTNANSSTNQGNTQGTGNQGKENGNPNSNNYEGGGFGNGVVPSLAGRKGISLPSPSNDFQEEGMVVVEITVDRQGKVIKAIPGVKKTTNLDATLLRLAKEAAYKAKFNVKADAPVLQKGTITYNFRLK